MSEDYFGSALFHIVDWELSLWIIGHYPDIYLSALEALMLKDEHDNMEWVLSIHLGARTNPWYDDSCPFWLLTTRIEPRETVYRRVSLTSMKVNQDPCPGAAASVRSAIAAGKRILLVHMFCDPVAFELCIIAPTTTPSSIGREDDKARIQNVLPIWQPTSNGGIF